MIEVKRKLSFDEASTYGEPKFVLELDYDQRSKGRLKAISTDGIDVGLFLERGKTLKDGDLLASENDEVVLVRAANESLIEAHCDDWLTFSRCCYHLGNRHALIQIDGLSLRMRPDHILEEMICSLGMTTRSVSMGFDPEQGAYSGGHGHSHHKY